MDDTQVFFHLECKKQIPLIKIKYKAMRTFIKFVKQIEKSIAGILKSYRLVQVNVDEAHNQVQMKRTNEPMILFC